MDNSKVTKSLQDYLAQEGMSYKKAEASIGISVGQLSNVAHGKHDKVSDELWRKLAAFFYKDDAWTLVETDNYSRIQNLCADAQKHRRMVGISENTGFGKTTALEMFKAGRPNVYMMTCDALMTEGDFLQELLTAMGIKMEGRSRILLAAIVEKLLRTENPLLIIDDAGKARGRILSIIQILFDKCIGKVGIVLSGTEAFRADLEKKIKRGRNGFAEFHRRIGYWLSLSAPVAPDVKAICIENGISDGHCINYLARHASNYGILREYIRNAMIYTQEHNCALTLEIVKQLNVGGAI